MNITVERILELVAEKGITEKQFLQDNGFNRTLLSDWKSGKSSSYKKHLAKIAAYFGVSTDYLLGNTNVRRPEQSAADLLHLLEDPVNREIFEKLMALPPQARRVALAQLDALAHYPDTADKP